MPRPHELLNEAMNQRRLELRMNWRQVAEEAGISYEALRAIRRGDYRPTELTARGLDGALRWTPSSVYAVLDGGDPTPLEQQPATSARTTPTGQQPTQGAPSLSQELDLAWRLLASTVKELGLSPDEAEEAWRLVREDIRRSHQSGADSGGTSETPRRRRAG